MFDNGAGAAAVEHTPTNLSALCDSNWHSVRVLKNRFMATLWVDSESPVSGATDNTNLVSVDIRRPLYAGGVPSQYYSILCSVGVKLVFSLRLS